MGQDKDNTPTEPQATFVSTEFTNPQSLFDPSTSTKFNPDGKQAMRYSSSSYTSSSSSSLSQSLSSSNEITQSPYPSPPLSRSSSRSSLSSSRSLERQSSKTKMVLVHPSIASPSNAKRLGDVRYVTVLYNPTSGNRRGERIMIRAVAKFQKQGLEVTTIQLQYKNHATEICRSKTDFEDIDILCVIGGDGTFHEVVNGLMQNPISHLAPHTLPALSVIPAGTGNSMVLELQGISSVRVSTDGLLFGTTVPIDILKVTILSVKATPPVNPVPYSATTSNLDCSQALEEEQKRLSRVCGPNSFVQKEVIYAFNSIHWGLASRILEKAEKLRWMGHGIRYTAATLMELLQGTSTNARIVLEDAYGRVTEYANDSFCLLIANNIGTAGKGMKMAPKAKINDGLIDVLLIRSHKPWHLMKIFERVYSGTHIDLPYVEYKQVRKFSIFPFKKTGELGVQGNPEYAEELVDIDGELKGCTPFECEVIPHALELII